LVKLGQYLFRGFGARSSPIDLDDVTKFTVEGTSSRILQCHGRISPKVDQVQSGQGYAAQRRELVLDVMVARYAPVQVATQLVDILFYFTLSDVVGFGKDRLVAAGNGTSDHGAQSPAPAALNLYLQRRLLNHHGAEKDCIGPIEVTVLERFHIQVHHAFLPVVREHGSHCQQA
jgi:hypothetical protein